MHGPDGYVYYWLALCLVVLLVSLISVPVG